MNEEKIQKAIIYSDEYKSSKIISSVTNDMGYISIEADSLEHCISLLEETQDVTIIILHQEKSGGPLLDIINYTCQNLPGRPVFILSEIRDIGLMTRSLECGVNFYLVQELNPGQINTLIGNAAPFSSLHEELASLRNMLRRNKVYGHIIGESSIFNKLFQAVDQVRESDINVLITGESGSGKELLAKAIHEGSNRNNAPFVAINCAGITTDIADSLLFGHTKGSFTGASHEHTGYFEQARGGTIFLDEIGDMHIEIQAKVLRTIEEKKILKVGSSIPQDIDFRIISATNTNLSEAISSRKFREDLFYRLEQYPLLMPTLRERKNDIPLLARHFLKQFCELYDIKKMTISETTLENLKKHTWPGNIRELKNIIRRAAIQSHSTILREISIAELSTNAKNAPDNIEGIGEKPFLTQKIPPLEETVKKAVLDAYTHTGENAPDTAKLLGISRSALYRKLKKYSII